MDALVKTAIESLVKKILPLLEQQLSGVLQKNLEKPSSELAYLIGESRELLDLMQVWTDSGKLPKGGEDEAKKRLAEMGSQESKDIEEMSDDETLMLMADMDDAPIAPSKKHKIPKIKELDDNEAAVRLAEMEGDDEAAAMLRDMGGDEAGDSEEELSDDEAAAMLAEMDGSPKDMDDDEAAALLAEMEAPKAKAPAKPAKAKDMDDDEAAALLAEMEAPKADDEELSDDEAAALLAEMEAPAPAKKAAAKPAPAASSKSMADDEASRLLAEMDDEPAPAPAKSAAAAHDAGHHEEVVDGEELKEIPEWEPNDFQSDPSMLTDFITNSDELMQTVDDAILRLEQDATNKSIIEEIFRAAHTLKGGAGMFGFKGIERVMHRMENLFDLIRKDKLIPTPETIDVVFQGIDLLRRLLQAVKDGGPCGVETVPVVHALSLAAKGKSVPKAAASAPAPQKEAPKAAAASAPAAPAAAAAPSAPGGGGGGGHDDDKKHDDKKQDDHKAKKTEQSTIRVDLERLDVLVNLVGELVIDRTRFASIEEDLRTNFPQIKLGSSFSETVQLFGRHMNEIQDIIMKVRMVPTIQTVSSSNSPT